MSDNTTSPASTPESSPQPAATQPAAATQESLGATAASPGPTQLAESAASGTAPQTVVSLDGVSAQGDVGALTGGGSIGALPAGVSDAHAVGAETYETDMAVLTEHLRAIEAHALKWGGQGGVDIRNCVGRLRDYFRITL